MTIKLNYIYIGISYIVISLVDYKLCLSGFHASGFAPSIFVVGTYITWLFAEFSPFLTNGLDLSIFDITLYEQSTHLKVHKTPYNFVNDCVIYNSIIVDDNIIFNDLARQCILNSLGFISSGITMNDNDKNSDNVGIISSLTNSNQIIKIVNDTVSQPDVAKKLNEAQRKVISDYPHNEITKEWLLNLEKYDFHNHLIFNKGVYIYNRFLEEHPGIEVGNYKLLLTLCNNNTSMGRWFKSVNDEFVTIATTPDWLKDDLDLYNTWDNSYVDSIQKYTIKMAALKKQEDSLRYEYKTSLEIIHHEKEEWLNNYVKANPVVAIDKITTASLPIESTSKHLGKGSKELGVALGIELANYKRELLRMFTDKELSPNQLQSLLKSAR